MEQREIYKQDFRQTVRAGSMWALCLLPGLIFLCVMLWLTSELSLFYVLFNMAKLVSLALMACFGMMTAKIVSSKYRLGQYKNHRLFVQQSSAIRALYSLGATASLVMLVFIVLEPGTETLWHFMSVAYAVVAAPIVSIIVLVVSLIREAVVKKHRDTEVKQRQMSLPKRIHTVFLIVCFLIGALPGILVYLALVAPLSSKGCDLSSNKYC